MSSPVSFSRKTSTFASAASSAALNKLISLNSKVKGAAGRLKLCTLRSEILEVFKLTRLDRVFDIRKTEEDALAAFKL
jgi:anti-sigma B factor antagonist